MVTGIRQLSAFNKVRNGHFLRFSEALRENPFFAVVAAIRLIYPDFVDSKGIDLEKDVFYAPFLAEASSTIQFLAREER
jgi:hypothetical protein